MFLLEHHGKELLASHGILIPAGVFVPIGGDVYASRAPEGPLIAKAQAATGGRGKAGAIMRVGSLEAASAFIAHLQDANIHGKPIHGFRIEQCIDDVCEAYLSLSLDAETARIRIMVAARGGTDVESREDIESVLADPDRLATAIGEICARLRPIIRVAMEDAASRLSDVFLLCEATLLEINPLFIKPDGNWIAGDVKLVVDDNAIARLPAIQALLERHPDVYPEAARKLAHGFDYVEVDPDGEIGLITTGAGLSMQLIDELKSKGRRPLNFCDIRSGQFRGDPARLIAVMRWIASRPSVRAVLVNIFAGITDLAEFARLLVQAAAAVPELRAPMVARLIGRNLDQATTILRGSNLPVTLEPDLDRAVALTLDALDGKGARGG